MSMTGKKLLTTATLAELKKRLPANQFKQFEEFKAKCAHYQREVEKHPEKLPNIDWETYRVQVPKDFVGTIDQYEVQYTELDKAFEARHELDYSRYYTDWEKIMKQCKKDVEAFKKESEERIKNYEMELKRKSEIKPIEEMSFEEFVTLRNDLAELVPRQNKPIFWPPVEEDQFNYVPPIKDVDDDDHNGHDEPKVKPKPKTVSKENPKMESKATSKMDSEAVTSLSAKTPDPKKTTKTVKQNEKNDKTDKPKKP